MTQRRVGIAAGIIKHMSHVSDGLPHFVDHITFDSFTLHEREGNKEPLYRFNERTRMSVNAVGLKNGGLRHFLEKDFHEALRIRSWCRFHR